MADLTNLTRLFQAIAEKDWDSAKSHAGLIASAEDEHGHHIAAQRLRGALGSGASSNGTASSQQSARTDGAFLTNALERAPSEYSLEELVLRPSVRRDLDEVVGEWEGRERLAKLAIPRRTRLIFHGPPGCGKSVTAKALARKLGIPVFVVRLDAVVGAYLGQTASNLRQLFHFAELTPAVLLLDELDALGKSRGRPQEVGELDRVVVALLQELEHSRPAGLLIATSNLARHLDNALWRRFDLAIEFPRPSAAALRAYIAGQLSSKGVPTDNRLRAELAQQRTFAGARRAIESLERRRALLAK